MLQRAILAALRAFPPQLVDRIRRISWLAPAVQRVVTTLSRPLIGREIEIGDGPAAGLKLHVDASSVAWATGRVELPVQTAIAARARPGDVVFDVGANVGFHTMLAARAVGPSGRVVAFEPHPANVLALERNLALNGFANVTVVPGAVSRRSGVGALSGRNRATAALGPAGVEVETVALDDYVAGEGGLPPPTLVKIDVEGHELEVLAGAEQLIARARPTLICELHGPPHDLVDAAARLGYGWEPIGAPSLQTASHVLLTPSRRD